MIHRFRNKLFLIIALLMLSGCQGTPFALLAGGSQTVAAGTSSYETYKSITMVKVGIDSALTANGKKTTTDVVLSRITGYDCRIVRSIKAKSLRYVCIEMMPEHLGNGEVHDFE